MREAGGSIFRVTYNMSSDSYRVFGLVVCVSAYLLFSATIGIRPSRRVYSRMLTFPDEFCRTSCTLSRRLEHFHERVSCISVPLHFVIHLAVRAKV